MPALETAPAPVADFYARDVDFGLDPARVNDWCGDTSRTLLFNVLSITFPVGERFFINSVASYRKDVADPKLRAEIAAFVQQEALHTREHIAYNKAISTIIDTAPLEQSIDNLLAYVKRTSPKLIPLAVTTALEHFTAILAKETLENPAHLKGAKPEYARLWTWHALEECEHKAVSYDVFQTVTGGRKEAVRILAMIPTSLILFYYLATFSHAVLKAQGKAGSPVAWAKFLWATYGTPGLFRRVIPNYLKYFRPGFHPNDIDDRAVLNRTKQLVESWV
jgi:predicted metal-dependent hydrolase